MPWIKNSFLAKKNLAIFHQLIQTVDGKVTFCFTTIDTKLLLQQNKRSRKKVEVPEAVEVFFSERNKIAVFATSNNRDTLNNG